MTDDAASRTPPSLKAVVAIGTSATHFPTAVKFVGKLELVDDLAVVVIFSNREALDEPEFIRQLKAVGREPTPITDNLAVDPGRLYLAPPDAIVTLDKRRFKVRAAVGRPGERGTIDSFLVSVGQNDQINTVAVLLGDTGPEGTLGVAAVKEGGGLTLAEQTGEDAGALQSGSSPASIVDFVMPVGALADRVTSHLRYIAQGLDGGPEGTSGAVRSIATTLRNQTGHDFHGYKKGTFLRRVHRRMQVLEIESLEAYAALLRHQPEEAQNLFNDLLIGVTQFFRDVKEFDVLEAQVIPSLFDKKTRNDALRIWVIGCSTGEEAYSIGILLRERMAKLDEVPQVQIFATDIDGRALASARAGRYAESVVKDVSPERLARWFVKEGNTYVIAKELREMCIFSQHSLIKDAPFSRLDMVSCRNLLIYLDSALQSRVIPLFHFALNRGGYLFLGNSENVSRHTNLFAPIENRYRVFRRLDTGTRIVPEFPFSTGDRLPAVISNSGPPRTVEGSVARSAERIVERYSPAYVIVDDAMNVLHFSARMGRYIEPAGGTATLSLLNLVHSDLRLDLRAALTKAAEQRQVIRADNLWIGTNGQRTLVDVAVEPVQDGPASPRSFVVVFKDGVTVPEDSQDAAPGSPLLRDEHIQRLETELRTTRDRLQTTVEEYESTNEELKSANEEYQSLNEELQSANEELETSKEELQSVNEELTTVNGELSHRVQELARANSDLKNLLESTRIATIFLDNEMHVTNYTPAATEIFPLVESDIGRPIGHIRSRVAYEDLQDDVRRVLRTLASVDREVFDPVSGTRYMSRILPYRSVDNFIGGAVVTFTDVTPLTAAQQAVRDSEKRFGAVANLVPDLLWSNDPSGSTNWFNRRWLDYTGQSSDEALGSGWLDAIHPQDKVEFLGALSHATQTGEALNREYRLRGADGSYRWFIIRAEPVSDGNGAITQWFGAGTDIEDSRVAFETSQRSESQAKLPVAELQHRVRNTLSVVRSIARRTAETSESAEEYASHLDGRLAALSRVQAIVTRDPASGVSLEQIIANELTAYAAREGEQLSIEGPDLRLTPKAAETMGLAIHELATNAVKYGSLSRRDGRLLVRWSVKSGEHRSLRFEWQETVPGGISPPSRRGFGMELIERMMEYELKARAAVAFESTGIRCSIELPLNGDVSVGPRSAG